MGQEVEMNEVEQTFKLAIRLGEQALKDARKAQELATLSEIWASAAKFNLTKIREEIYGE